MKANLIVHDYEGFNSKGCKKAKELVVFTDIDQKELDYIRHKTFPKCHVDMNGKQNQQTVHIATSVRIA